jgi:hypothetical protein
LKRKKQLPEDESSKLLSCDLSCLLHGTSTSSGSAEQLLVSAGLSVSGAVFVEPSEQKLTTEYPGIQNESLKMYQNLTAGRAKKEMAKTEKQEATILPIQVLGTVSPYPIVVTVI